MQVKRNSEQEMVEKEQALSELSARIVEQEQIIQNLTSQLEEKEQASSDLSARMIEKDQAIRSLSSEVREKQETIKTLSSQLSEAEQTARTLSSQMMMKERSSEALSEQLSAKEYELRKITGTLGWRLLIRYGRIKYPYLLPLYRALGLPPYDKKAAANVQKKQLSGKGQAMQPVPMPSLDDKQTVTEQVALQGQPYIAYESNAYDIVCFPIIDWDFRFQRPQQLMSRFAAAGHRVFYLAQAFYSSGPPYTIREKRKNIYEISLRGPERNVYTDVLDDNACDAFVTSLDALRRDLSLDATVSFVQLPFWSSLADKARAQFAWPVVYDCMDHHAGFSTNTQRMIDQEHDLLTSADLVVVTSEFLEKQARQHNSNVLQVRNGCEYEHFATAGETQNERPVIGYYGAIADWFDSDLVADLAERRSDWDFVLVGSTFSADTRRLSKLPNVSLPGEKHYSEIPDWVNEFDVVIIPFKRTALTEATNPVKAYEILASGKPLISVPIPEVASLAPLVRLASNAEEFENEIVAALGEDAPKFVEERRAFAKEHTWEKRYEVLSPAVRNVFPKASIMIVTFNNLELNRLCLESLYARTEWPNFDVIVLDNASTDGTPEYLKEAEKTFPNLCVILNNANLGFARANNIGLKQASGEYLVLLNNDTVLARGWLSALIRHLHTDPNIGMLGPVTNEIGNEAKVPVGYKRLEDMPRWAANYVHENDNRLFHIPMLAMFCVMMRREVYERVGLLDEDFDIGMFEDDDYTRRVRENGYEIVCTHDSFVHHFGRASFKTLSEERYRAVFQRNRRVYENKWGIWQPHMDNDARGLIPGFCDQMNKIIEESRVDPSRIVLFPPSISWNNAMMQRPHHLALELARQGFLVFFDCSGSSGDDFAGFARVEKDLWLYKGPQGVLDTLEHPVLWLSPHNASLFDRWANCTIVYDWSNDLSDFPYNHRRTEIHKKMLQRADLVLCVFRNVQEQAKDQRSDALCVPNGVEYVRFSSTTNSVALDPRFKTMLDEGRPVVGYYGVVASWFDVDMLLEVADARPDWSFVIIGDKLPDAPSLEALENKSNVLILPAQKYESLPGYLSRFTASAIPFKLNETNGATSALRLYEPFAAGKPVISTRIPECQSFEEVLIVGDAQEFSAALDVARVRSSDSSFQERLRSLGRENSWAARVQMVASELSKKLQQDHK